MASKPKFRKGEFVEYSLEKVGKGRRVVAVVRRAHRNNTATVEARFVLNAEGEREGGYLGYRYTYPVKLLRKAEHAH